jgi:hypothetical protein
VGTGCISGKMKLIKEQILLIKLEREPFKICISVVMYYCLFVCFESTSNFSAIWRLSPLPVTGLQI